MESQITKRLIQEGVLIRDEGKNSIASVKNVVIETHEDRIHSLEKIRDSMLDKVAILDATIDIQKHLSESVTAGLNVDKIKVEPEKKIVSEPEPLILDDVEKDLEEDLEKQGKGLDLKLLLMLRALKRRLNRKAPRPRRRAGRRTPPVDVDKSDPRRGKRTPPVDVDKSDPRRGKFESEEAKSRARLAEEAKRQKALQDAEKRRAANRKLRDAASKTISRPIVMVDAPTRKTPRGVSGRPSLTLTRPFEFRSTYKGRGTPRKLFTLTDTYKLPTVDKTGRVTRYSDDARARRTSDNTKKFRTGPTKRGKVTGAGARIRIPVGPRTRRRVTGAGFVPKPTPVGPRTRGKVTGAGARIPTPTGPTKRGKVTGAGFVPKPTPVGPRTRGKVTGDYARLVAAEKLLKEAETLQAELNKNASSYTPDEIFDKQTRIQAKIDTVNSMLAKRPETVKTVEPLKLRVPEGAPKPFVAPDSAPRVFPVEPDRPFAPTPSADEAPRIPTELDTPPVRSETPKASPTPEVPESPSVIPDDADGRAKFKKANLGSILKGVADVGGKALIVLSFLGPLAGRNEEIDSALESVSIPGTDYTLLDILNDPRAQETSMPYLVEFGKDIVTLPTDLIDLGTMLGAWVINKGFGTELEGTTLTERLINGPYYAILAKNAEFLGAYRGSPEAKVIMDNIMLKISKMSPVEITNLDNLTVLRIETLGSPDQREKFYRMRNKAQQTLVDYAMGEYEDKTDDARARATKGEVEVPEKPNWWQRLFFGDDKNINQQGSSSRKEVRKRVVNTITDPSGSFN